MQSNWGANRLRDLQTALLDFVIVGVTGADMTELYAEIDTFSQGKLPSKRLGTTARNMGKNDLWIAATASLLHATLLTTDADFDHLDGAYLTLEKLKYPA